MSEEKNQNKKQNKKKRSVFRKIVNGFLFFLIGVFVLILLLLGFTQTSTFKEFLREKVVETANAELNGKLHIGQIDGTIFTSLILYNTSITLESDTIIYAEKIEVLTSPFKLLGSEIFIRKFEITNGDINLVTDSSGVLNIAKLFPESEEDTTTSEFPLIITAENIGFTNMNFSFRNYKIPESNEIYEELMMDDLRISDLDLLASAQLDINKNSYKLELKRFSFNPNVSALALKNLTGDFIVNDSLLRAKDIHIVTESSDIELNAELTGYNFFDTAGISQFSEAGVSLNLKADQFNFGDLSKLTPVDMLKGKVTADLSASGTMKNLKVENLELALDKSHIQLRGDVLNLAEPGQLYLSLNSEDTYIDQSDIKDLFAGDQISTYTEYGLLRFDTLKYSGTVDDFDIILLLRTDQGQIYTTGNLNLQKENIAYDVYIRTQSLNIAPFAGLQTQLNIRTDIKGVGSEPAKLLADIRLIGDGSTIEGNVLDTLRFTADAKNKRVNYNLTAVKDTASAELAGYFNFENKYKPSYELEGTLQNLNLATFTNDTTTESSLNFSMNGSGEGFNPDSINLFLSMNLKNSVINDIRIDSTRAIIDLQNGTEGERVINIISDLADITFIGKYSVDQAIDVFTREFEILQNVLNEQLEQIAPGDTPVVRETALNIESKQELTTEESIADSVMSISYLVDLKDFALLSLFLGSKTNVEIDGEMNGEIKSDGDSLRFTYNTFLEYIKFRDTASVFFLSNLNLNVNLRNSLDTASIDKLYADLNLTTDRIFMGSNINNLSLQLSLDNRSALMDFSAQLEDYASVDFNGGFKVADNIVFLNLDTLLLNYKNFNLNNSGEITIGYSEDEISVENFHLVSDSAEILIDGSLLTAGGQSMDITVKNLSLNKLSTTLLKLQPENALSGWMNLESEITGSIASPVIDMSVKLDSITYKNQNFGYMTSEVNYSDQLLKAEIRFVDSIFNTDQAAMVLTASVPLYLSLQPADETPPENAPLNIQLEANEFNLAAFGDILPEVNKLRGRLSADVTVNGTLADPVPAGYLELEGGAFIVEANNLEYYANIRVDVEDELLILEKMQIQNSSDTPNGGTMTGSGTAALRDMELVSSDFKLSGTLKVLSPNSKSASPGVYGDLVIATNGNIEFTMDENGAKLTAPIVVKQAELTFPPTQGAYENTASNFVYKYVEDTTAGALKTAEMDFESLVEISRQRGQSQEIRKSKESTFDYKIDVKVEDEAEIVFVLSPELNQNLTAILKGDFSYSSINGKTTAQGQLKLLEGSTLEFIKTFQADGSIRFEDELDNPYLNITATYRDYYYPPDSSAGANEVLVAVKIKLQGFLKELDKTFVREENNIAVYYGEDNIEENSPDPTKTPTDAIMFIITGRFASDLTQSERTAAAGQFTGTATSMAGSILGGFLNRQFGDYVKSVELRRVGSETKFNLSGRVKDFRYTIGGSTDVFEDLSQANIRIEYPIIQNLLLRLERKEAITEKTINPEMINEVGLKYRFEF